MRLSALAAAAFATGALLAGAAPGASATRAADALNLWSGLNQTGQVQPVPAPEEAGCVTVDAAFRARSAGNRSQRIASLYTDQDCDGEPAEVVSPGRRINFARPLRIESVAFQ
ncbi:peptidase inhibitor family I36 protein [Nonomuraea sp. NPDC001699]